ncbi:MAG: class I SAM-dependent methyltransferase [Robiginitomaculum sp.]|nr:class I SAM-dependent methyltransferase [Robiginitomaculum sp.]
MTSRTDHWQQAWGQNPQSKSWVQTSPALSLAMISACGLAKTAPILDMGGGASLLVDCLLDEGYRNITVADISETALQLAQKRLDKLADQVKWEIADACNWHPTQAYELWHDRAVFHFLTKANDRTAYKQRVYEFVPKGGFLVMACFTPDGPKQCSNLPVVGYDGASLAAEIGTGFALMDEQTELHVTPNGGQQKFQYTRFQRV